jgi:hypothetical protein
MRQQVQAISLVVVVSAVLAACGPLGSSSQVVSLSDIALHPDEVPSGLTHCSALSGAYPAIAHAFDHPNEDSQAWNAALTNSAMDAWVEIYRGRADYMRANFDQCTQWSTANTIDGNLGPSIQNVVIKYKNAASAHSAFIRGEFVPLQKLDCLASTYTVVGGQPTGKGTATGLGADSFTEHGTFFTDTFYRAYWQTGQYVATIVAHYLPTLDDGSKAAFRVDSRIPREAAVAPSCSGLSAGTGVISGDHLQYPASGIPAMTIYAVSASNPHQFCSVRTAQNQTTYSIVGIPTGTYHVLAYPLIFGPPGGYTKYVVCGSKPACADHSLVNVAIKGGETVTGINPNDYYGWNGKYPPEPTP